ncbi:hypothetical protein GMJLKIPL_2800 [Methylobacterium isbiliense]|jgi:hypothetical protein|uniref:30S ribosomal protein S11 n=2 Tax=Methylobacterium TaxID=407 RepID=A0ABQ4T9L6_METOR|nr:hypothetical protein GMJLKIPL_2800 [Methylobacterium isbiliense]GJE27575.1 hypothetical protein LKMONMHP_2435 [Methylobacterium organophilum]
MAATKSAGKGATRSVVKVTNVARTMKSVTEDG